MEHLVMAMERWMEKDVSRPQRQEGTRRSEDKEKEKSGRSSLLNSPYKKNVF